MTSPSYQNWAPPLSHYLIKRPSPSPQCAASSWSQRRAQVILGVGTRGWWRCELQGLCQGKGCKLLSLGSGE